MQDLSFLIAIIAVVLAAALAVTTVVVRRRSAGAAIEHEFNRVFMTTMPAGREALIKRWMDKKGCSRGEAMRLAIKEWRRESR
jgi:hypothetical protein